MYLLAIDPGRSSGAVLGYYNHTEPFVPVQSWQLGGGVIGLRDWWRSARLIYDEVVVEKYVPLSGQGFAQTLDSVEPLRCEGFLVSEGVVEDYQPKSPQWQRANEQYFRGGTGKVDKRKRSKLWLKEHGLYLTGGQLEPKRPDSEDRTSALLHAFARMRKINHGPTMAHYFKEDK